MEENQLHLGDGAARLKQYRGRLSATKVLARYKDEDLPAFCGVDLTDEIKEVRSMSVRLVWLLFEEILKSCTHFLMAEQK